MAITPILNSDTPYSKQLLLVGAGVAEIFTLADFELHLADGPLKQKIRSANGLLALFNVDASRGDEIRIYDVPLASADASLVRNRAFTIAWVNAPPNSGLSCTLEAGDTRRIEIRCNHTTQG
jgi:hypothetical protein